MNSQFGRIEKDSRTTLHRRAFIGTTALALPALSRLLNAQGSAAQVDNASADRVTKQVERELAATIKRAQGKVRSEHLRALAATLRISHAHYAATGVWAAADKGLARLIARNGSVANLALSGPDKNAKSKMDAAIRALGIEISHNHRPVDTQALATAFDALKKNGFEKTVGALSASLDGLAAVADDQPQPAVALAAARQRNDELCWQIWWNMYIADAACLSMMVTGPAAGFQICMLALFLHMYYDLNGC